MSDSDDLAGPPPTNSKKVILTDSDEDVGPPAPRAPAAKPAGKQIPVLSDTDSDTDSDQPPPPPRKSNGPVVLSETDSSSEEGIGPAPARPAISSDESDDPAPPSSPIRQPWKPPARSRNNKPKKKSVGISGWLMKMQPTWPYSAQKRWIVLKKHVLTYYDQEGGKQGGVLDLRGAKVLTEKDGIREKFQCKLPHTFGLSGQRGLLKERVFLFSAATSEQILEWTTTIQRAARDSSKQSDIHWFEKMATGTH